VYKSPWVLDRERVLFQQARLLRHSIKPGYRMRTYEFDVPNGMSSCEIKDFAGAASNAQVAERMIFDQRQVTRPVTDSV
jgi:hypothetical protein